MPIDCSDLDGLADSAKCILESTSPEQRQAMIVYLLATIAGVSTDPTDLASASKCILSSMTIKQMKAAQTQLLCTIVNL